MRRLLPVLAAALIVLVVGAGPASAHNVLRSTTPTNGQTVAQTPPSVVLTFDEPAIAMGTQIAVVGPNGDVAAGSPRLVDDTVTQDLQPGSPAGAYTVTWRVTSVDGHPVGGTFTFTSSAVGAGTPVAPSPSASQTTASDGRRQPLIPSWGWIAAGILIIVGAVQVGRRNRRNDGDSER